MLNELLVGYSKVEFETVSVDWAGIGDANATIGIPGGQPIPGLSAFNISDFGFGSAGHTQFNDIKTYQLNNKFSWFKGRHSMKFGGRWLYQDQGFAYAGNEGTLGHFDYGGAFTGFALCRLPARPRIGEGARRRGGAVHAHRSSRRPLRAGRFSHPRQPHAEPRALLGVHLALGREGRPPVEHRSPDRATAARRPERQQPRALRRLLRRVGAARRLCVDAVGGLGRARCVRHRAVHGRHRQEPAAAREPAVQLRRPARLRPDDRRRQRRGWIRRHHSQHRPVAREPSIGSSLPT